MLFQKLKFSPLIAIIFALGTGSLGVKAMFSSYAATPTGSIKVRTCVWKDGNCNTGIGMVEVHTDSVGSTAECTDRNKTTSTDTNSATFTGCPVASSGAAKQYEISYVKRDGYAFRSLHGDLIDGNNHNQNSRYYVKSGQTTNLTIYMNDLTPPPPAPAPPPSSPSPSPTPTNKNGSIQLTTYIYNSDGTRTRIGNVTAHVQSVGFATTDVEHNCTAYNKTTDSAGGSTAANSNYGQAHFTQCWSGSQGTKAYKLSYLEIPSGYSFRSFHMTSGSFTNGGTGSQNAQEYFNVLANQETRIEVWMNKIPPPSAPTTGSTPTGGGSTSTTPSGSAPSTSGGAVHQVITSTGTSYTAANNKPQSVALATALNAISLPPHGDNPVRGLGDTLEAVIGNDQLDPDGEENDEEEAPIPVPSAPNNLKAVQDGSGSVALTWEVPNGNPADITYTIERIAEAEAESSELDSVDGLSWIDDTELDYPKPYTYRVYAVNLDGEVSNPAVAQVTTHVITPNIPAVANEQAGQQVNGGNGQPGQSEPQPVQVTSPENNGTILVPAGANETAMACGIVAGEGQADDMLEDSGDTVGGASRMLCREEDGDVVEEFDEDIEFSLEFDEDELSDDSALYGFDGTDWEEIDTEEVKSEDEQVAEDQDSKSRGLIKYASAKKVKGKKTKYTVNSRKPLTLAVLDKKDPSKAKAFVTGAGILSLFTLGGALMIRRQLELNARRVPYGDIDLISRQLPSQPAQLEEVVIQPKSEDRS